jgi:phosphatidylglycerol:prolipoprotein diacylglycerol transferase
MVPRLGVAYQPVFFYEMFWDLAVFGVVWLLRGRLKTDGTLFGTYLGLYTLGKFALTFLLTETIWLWGLQEAQLPALAGMAIAVVWVLAATRVHAPRHAR